MYSCLAALASLLRGTSRNLGTRPRRGRADLVHTCALVTLDNELRSILDARAGVWGLYARRLDTNETVAIRAEEVMPAQSSVKVCVLLTYSRRVARGEETAERRITVTSNDHALGGGVLRYLTPGLSLTLGDLSWLMIVLSDNVATRILIRELGGPDAVNAEMDDLGLPSLRVHDPTPGASHDFSATPHDLAEIYTHVDERCREILYRREHVDFLPRRIPHLHDLIDHGLTAPVRVYGKSGSGPCECIDAGLFETDASSWIVAAMAKDLPDLWQRPDFAGPRTLADIGETIFNAWGQ